MIATEINQKEKQKRIVFGYNRGINNKIEQHSLQAMTVEFIYRSYADGDSLRTIKRTLESAGIISPQNKPVWSQQSIANILAYDQYIGDDTYPKIIDKALYDRVRSMQRGRSSKISKT